MGIPRFYRWLSERYPRINQRIEENVELLPEFDNMYLDANGIIHTCSHPNDEDVTSAKLSMEDMALNMMGYIDNMVKIIRPKKVLFLAVDGCAPRAKMNQQRSRRFASARDSEAATKKAIEAGDMSQEEAANRFDSNVITPGTPFMAELSRHFEFFLRKKIKEDPVWQDLEVIYSGHDVPGEGEHKIMEYIRRTRSEPDYNPNTRHCLCGLDADLMMLGLATHEPHFSLLREEVNFGGFSSKQNRNATKEVNEQIAKVKWQLLRISTLRDYMALEYASVRAVYPELNFERVVDDWVLMVMLVGNDFLPPVPSMDIFEGGMDTLIALHKELVGSWKGNLTRDDATLDWGRIETLFRRLGSVEADVFQRRETEKRDRDRKERKMMGDSLDDDGDDEIETDMMNDADAALLTAEDDLWSAEVKIKHRRRRMQYYTEKFGIAGDDPFAEDRIAEVVKRYAEGLQWVFSYYYQGVPSWIWFYPFHYAPLASDVRNLVDTAGKIRHVLGEPFKPFNQLLGCLPASSAHCLPPSYQKLMRDPSSPVRDFYPTEWEVDSNGKRNPWEFVNLLPFIDERRLAEAVSKINQGDLTPEERARNEFGVAYSYRRDISNTARLESTLRKLQSLDACLTSKREFKYSTHALTARHNPNLLRGYRTLPGDSTLFVHPLLSQSASGLRMARLNTFGSPSRKETFVLRFSTKDIPKTPEDIKSFFDGLTFPLRVWINYPHLHEAELTRVVDVFGNCFEAQERKWRELTNGERKSFDTEALGASSKSLGGDKLVGTGGIELDRVFVMARVRPLLGMKQDPATGQMRQYFAETEDDTWIPFQLMLFSNPLRDSRFEDAAPLPLEARFPPESKVLCVAEKGYGMLGSVLGPDREAGAVVVKFPAKAPRQNEFGHVVAGTIHDTYTPLSRIAQGLNLLPTVVDKFFGSLKVVDLLPRERGRPQIVDLGLNLRVGRDRVIPGYVRSKASDATSAAWKSHEAVVRVVGGLRADEESSGVDTRNVGGENFEYSDRAIELLLKYKTKFPRLFERVAKKPHENEYRRGDLFNIKENPTEPDLLMTWLRQIPTYGMALVPTSSRFMSRSAVVAVQRGAEEYVRAEQSGPPVSEVPVTLPPHVLCRAPTLDRGTIVSPTADVVPGLGDRVCNLGNPVVPFGLKGTIVAIHPSTAAVHVVFDIPFPGGSSLSGMCLPLTGFLLPSAHILNLSKKRPVPLDAAEIKIAPRKPSSSVIQQPKRTDSPASKPITTAKENPTPKQAVKPAIKDKQVVKTTMSDSAHVPAVTTSPVMVPSPVAEGAPDDDEDDDSLAFYFKKLMAAKLKSAAAPTGTSAAISSTTAPSAASATPKLAKSAWHKDTTEKSEPASKTTAPPGKPKAAGSSKVTSIAQRPTVVPETQAAKVISIAQRPAQSPVQPPAMPPHMPQGMMPPQSGMNMPHFAMGVSGVIPQMPPHFVQSYLPPQGYVHSPMIPAQAAPVPSPPMSETAQKTSAVLDNVFKRAFQTENRTFGQ